MPSFPSARRAPPPITAVRAASAVPPPAISAIPSTSVVPPPPAAPLGRAPAPPCDDGPELEVGAGDIVSVEVAPACLGPSSQVVPPPVERPTPRAQGLSAPSPRPIAGRREPTGPQRVARAARALGVRPSELIRRVGGSRCAVCDAPVAFARTYFQHRHTCAKCEPSLPSALAASLRELDRWI